MSHVPYPKILLMGADPAWSPDREGHEPGSCDCPVCRGASGDPESLGSWAGVAACGGCLGYEPFEAEIGQEKRRDEAKMAQAERLFGRYASLRADLGATAQQAALVLSLDSWDAASLEDRWARLTAEEFAESRPEITKEAVIKAREDRRWLSAHLARITEDQSGSSAVTAQAADAPAAPMRVGLKPRGKRPATRSLRPETVMSEATDPNANAGEVQAAEAAPAPPAEREPEPDPEHYFPYSMVPRLEAAAERPAPEAGPIWQWNEIAEKHGATPDLQGSVSEIQVQYLGKVSADSLDQHLSLIKGRANKGAIGPAQDGALWLYRIDGTVNPTLTFLWRRDGAWPESLPRVPFAKKTR